MRTILRAFSFLVVAAASPALAVVTPVYFSHRVEAPFETPGGFRGEITLLLEDVTNLDAGHLQIQVFDLADPGLLAARLNPGDPVGKERRLIPAAFPVKIKVLVSSGFQFAGRWRLELRTPHLEFTPFTPLRLFRSPDAVSPFVEITEGVGKGSFRVQGVGGTFSEFVVAADLRPLRETVQEKLGRARQTILDHPDPEIDPVVASDLEDLLDQAEAAHDLEDFATALARIDLFLDRVVLEAAATNVEDTYDADDPTPISVAGELRSIAESLRLGLELRAEGRPLLGTGAVSRRLLPGLGLTVDVRVVFPDSFEIDLADLEVEAEIVDPADLVARLPAGVAVPAGFPVLVRVNPTSSELQAFSGPVEIELRTPDLDFGADSSLRLFKSPDGGVFEEITATLGLGSFRVQGVGGTFSELMILRDLRSLDAVASQRFGRLQSLLDTHAAVLDSAVLSALQTQLDAAAGFYQADALGSAIGELDALLELVSDAAGDGIPNIWANQGVRVNVAGLLASEASALRLNLVVQKAPLDFDPADANRDGQVDVDDVFYVISRVYPGQ